MAKSKLERHQPHLKSTLIRDPVILYENKTTPSPRTYALFDSSYLGRPVTQHAAAIPSMIPQKVHHRGI